MLGKRPKISILFTQRLQGSVLNLIFTMVSIQFKTTVATKHIRFAKKKMCPKLMGNGNSQPNQPWTRIAKIQQQGFWREHLQILKEMYTKETGGSYFLERINYLGQLFITIFCMYVCAHVHDSCYKCEGQRTTCRVSSFFSILWNQTHLQVLILLASALPSQPFHWPVEQPLQFCNLLWERN